MLSFVPLCNNQWYSYLSHLGSSTAKRPECPATTVKSTGSGIYYVTEAKKEVQHLCDVWNYCTHKAESSTSTKRDVSFRYIPVNRSGGLTPHQTYSKWNYIKPRVIRTRTNQNTRTNQAELQNVFCLCRRIGQLRLQLEMIGVESWIVRKALYRDGLALPDSGLCNCWKKGNSFSLKDMHCQPVLAFLQSPTEWPTFCQNSSTCYYFLQNKLNFHLLKSLFSAIAHAGLPLHSKRSHREIVPRECFIGRWNLRSASYQLSSFSIVLFQRTFLRIFLVVLIGDGGRERIHSAARTELCVQRRNKPWRCHYLENSSLQLVRVWHTFNQRNRH